MQRPDWNTIRQAVQRQARAARIQTVRQFAALDRARRSRDFPGRTAVAGGWAALVARLAPVGNRLVQASGGDVRWYLPAATGVVGILLLIFLFLRSLDWGDTSGDTELTESEITAHLDESAEPQDDPFAAPPQPDTRDPFDNASASHDGGPAPVEPEPVEPEPVDPDPMRSLEPTEPAEPEPAPREAEPETVVASPPPREPAFDPFAPEPEPASPPVAPVDDPPVVAAPPESEERPKPKPAAPFPDFAGAAPQEAVSQPPDLELEVRVGTPLPPEPPPLTEPVVSRSVPEDSQLDGSAELAATDTDAPWTSRSEPRHDPAVRPVVRHVREYAAATASTTTVQAPAPQLTVSTPFECATSGPCRVAFEVRNPHDVPLQQVVVEIDLPDELTHPFGPKIDYDAGDLAPGTTQRARLVVRGAKPGTGTVRLVARTVDASSPAASREVEVRPDVSTTAPPATSPPPAASKPAWRAAPPCYCWP